MSNPNGIHLEVDMSGRFNSTNGSSEQPSSNTTEAMKTQHATGEHHMMTRLKTSNASITHTSLVATKGPTDDETKTVDQALSTPHKYAAMKEEVDALHENQT
ncbi:hypothetical protein HAX54_001523 [Datura stramonium]|uniref:Uncharacterized protein n=1 Tax=Datura stramonium TaxID=4076 RepID=A0ABS8RU67_DATST|nr:hypothetical protein [Datura stramonium]